MQYSVCSIQSISSVFQNLFSETSVSVEEHVKKLQTFEILCPKLLTLRFPECSAADNNNIEVSFESVPSISALGVNKRRKIFLDSLFNFLFQFYLNRSHKTVSAADFQFQLNSGELDFNFESCLLPQMENAKGEPTMPTFCDGTLEWKSPDTFVTNLKDSEIYRGQMSHIERILGRKARYDILLRPLPQLLLCRLESCLKIKDGEFYTHQASAINAIRGGSHVAISTSTASGKSIIYNVSVLDAILQDKEVTALYLFPTKALAQDQLRSIQEFTGFGSIIPATACVCDGDTSQSERFAIQEHEGNIILTNPDMLHVTLLPEHKKWTRVWKNLRFVVIDEAHYYKGAFGAHVAMVLRRLTRVCLHYSLTCPQFICCSATILNPEEHMRKLVPLDMIATATAIRGESKRCEPVVIGSDMDGSPQGERTFIIWNPPLRRESLDIVAVSEKSNASSTTKKNGKTCSHLQTLSCSSNLLHRELNEIEHGNLSSMFDGESSSHHHQSSAVSQFVEGCADRPSTLGESTANEFHEVTFQGGWKRKRNLKTAARNKSASLATNFECTTIRNSQLNNSIENKNEQSFRTSSIFETSQLFALLVKKNIRTLAFCRVRKLVELVLKYTLSNLDQSAPHLKDQVASYRGGYTMKDRRQIESNLFSGQLIGVTATCALELGIDLGCLDATLHLGFPGTFSSLWQQAGRAGRGGRDALSIMICFECPVDQYFARNPEVLFHSPVERAVLDIDNIHILRQHLLCAAKELPLHNVFNKIDNTSFIADTELLWGCKYAETLDYLREARSIVPVSGDDLRSRERIDNLCALWKYNPCASVLKENPARSVIIRQIDPVTISIIDDTIEDANDKQIDSLGYSRAFFELFEGAIYMHRGEQYLVHKLDLQACVAHTRPVKVQYLTSARNRTNINVIKPIEGSGVMNIGVVQVIFSVYGYDKYWLGSNKIMESCESTLPPLEYETLAFWIDLPLEIKKSLEEEGLNPLEAIHGANHVLESLCPLFAQCDAGDIGTEHGFTAQDHKFRMMIFDKRSGGLGAANAIYERRHDVIRQAAQLLSSCPCDSKYPRGCPSCLLDLRCTSYNNHISKSGALRLFQLLTVYMQNNEITTPPTNDAVLVTPTLTTLTNSCCSIMNESNTKSPLKSNKAAAEVDESPRKKKRQKALQSTRLRNSVRARQMAVQMNWTESIPTFTTDALI
eukprot:CAMPEP_0170110342 /NCGR_PEP_ID=MMETSP0020_2-20130122/7790_1 /TAXON_ID=98059 /ORGANISM="Dinobryon sp., Strain UTEXLB2267" /LENGTH=1196 /DNA_ID=CAMNT_0010335597 /DNA_START=57 /DNA_END=3647 /DNA_ORIENTATION=+